MLKKSREIIDWVIADAGSLRSHCGKGGISDFFIDYKEYLSTPTLSRSE
jgi:hypothetical protein